MLHDPRNGNFFSSSKISLLALKIPKFLRQWFVYAQFITNHNFDFSSCYLLSIHICILLLLLFLSFLGFLLENTKFSFKLLIKLNDGYACINYDNAFISKKFSTFFFLFQIINASSFWFLSFSFIYIRLSIVILLNMNKAVYALLWIKQLK